MINGGKCVEMLMLGNVVMVSEGAKSGNRIEVCVM